MAKLVRRRKTYRDENGVIVGYGAQESYIPQNPRDYSVNPLREGEVQNTSFFAKALIDAIEELKDPVKRAEWSRLWHAQLEVAEPDAPIDRKTGQRHIYRRLDRYVQSVLFRQMKAGNYKTA